tara:strand:+ start:506 stop:655 length:150 start_codon:yes stop_codon:yes gene_type:complete
MSETCKVVTIKTENGLVEINESDFDKSIHKLAHYKSKPSKANKADKTES